MTRNTIVGVLQKHTDVRYVEPNTNEHQHKRCGVPAHIDLRRFQTTGVAETKTDFISGLLFWLTIEQNRK